MSGGGSFGMSKSKSKSSSLDKGNEVWQAQQPYLTNKFSGAEAIMNRQMGNQWVPGATQTRQVLNPAYSAAKYNPLMGLVGGGDGQYWGEIPGQGTWSGGGQPQYITETYQDPGSWQYSGQDAPEVAQAKDLMAKMGMSFEQANAALNSGGQYMTQGYNAMQGANPNFDQAGNYFNQAGAGYNSFMNPGVNPMQDVYRRQIAQAFSEDIMPELQGQQMMSGGFGGSRGQIGEALAGARASQQLQDFSAQLYDQDMNRKLAASQGLAGVGQGMTSLGNARVGQGTALGNLGAQQASLASGYQNNAAGMAGLADMGMALPWYAMQQYAGLIGDPTMKDLGGSSKSKGNAFGFNMSGGGGYGGGGKA